MTYAVQSIRNVCLLGHSGNGKTTLVESAMFLNGATDRMGRTADGNTICDFDSEEIKRQASVYTAVAPVEYSGSRINFLDTPGNFDFTGEVQEALRVCDLGLIVCNAKDEVSVGTERAWKLLEERDLPRMIFINKTDEDNGDYNGTLERLREKFGKSVAPLISPIWNEEKKVVAVVDVIHKRAFEVENGKAVEIPIPEEKVAVVDELYEALKESVAETSEEFMDKYFSGEEFTYAEMMQGLRTGVRERSLFPLLCGSAYDGLGIMKLLDVIVDLGPNPAEAPAEPCVTGDGKEDEYIISAAALPAALVFKTVADQYGKFSYVKVMSGKLTPDMAMVNASQENNEKLGRLYTIRGKKYEEVKELSCGEIGAIGKMDKVKTGDTLCAPGKIFKLEGVGFYQPTLSKAIAPKTRGQDDKVAQGLMRLNEEDPSFKLENNAETHQMVLTVTGEVQLDVLLSKLKNRFNVEAEVDVPRVAYREMIRKTVEKQGRHKKQTGGSGQFGDVWIRFAPGDSEEMEFCEEVFGGSVPKNYFPAVEKGLREACVKGPLAGYPVVNLKATLYDGSYHPVDSSEIAFKTAAQIAYKAAMPEASPVLLEPIGALKVTIPDTYLGDIMGDLNKRRGRVMGMTPTAGGNQVVEAEVPMAEMMSYTNELRAMTQSRGSFELEFVRYEEAPMPVQQKVIEEAKQAADD